MTNDTDLTMIYPSLQNPDGSTVVLAPGESFDETAEPGQVSPPGDASSAAEAPADVTPPAAPSAVWSDTPAE